MVSKGGTVKDLLVTIVPIYRTEPTASELARISVSIKNAVGPVFFVAPDRLDISVWGKIWPSADFRFFAAAHFSSVEAYSRWLLTTEIYREFSDFEFLLVCQTDAVLDRGIDFLQELDFDYVGAPWDGFFSRGWNPFTQTLETGHQGITVRRLGVGNGGLSLRRTSSFVKGLPKFPKLRNFVNEDQVISYFGPAAGIRIADRGVAGAIFMETAARSWDPGDSIPNVYGCHALEKYNPTLEKAILVANGEGATTQSFLG